LCVSEAPAEDFSPSHYQEEQHHQEPQSPTQHQQEVNGGGGEQGRCARALYDYQACEYSTVWFCYGHIDLFVISSYAMSEYSYV